MRLGENWYVHCPWAQLVCCTEMPEDKVIKFLALSNEVLDEAAANTDNHEGGVISVPWTIPDNKFIKYDVMGYLMEMVGFYIDTILTRLTTIGALYLTLVCLMPEFLIANYPIPFYLGGTSILIVVVVAIDTVTQVQTRLMSSQYEQLIKKTKFGR